MLIGLIVRGNKVYGFCTIIYFALILHLRHNGVFVNTMVCWYGTWKHVEGLMS